MINPDIAYNLRFTIYSPFLVNRVCRQNYFVLKELVCTITVPKSRGGVTSISMTRAFKMRASELALVFKEGASELAPSP